MVPHNDSGDIEGGVSSQPSLNNSISERQIMGPGHRLEDRSVPDEAEEEKEEEDSFLVYVR